MIYDEAYVSELKRLRERGLTVQQIADKMGKTKKTMQRHLHDVGLTANFDRSDIKDEDILRDWNEKNLTVNQIAQKYQCSHDTITKRLAKYDIKSKRAAGIKRHFSETYKMRWPLIKADLDKGMCVTMVREKYHIRIENLKELMKENGYVQQTTVPKSVYEVLVQRIKEEREIAKCDKRRNCLFYLEAVKAYIDKYDMIPSVNAFLSFTGCQHRGIIKSAIVRYDLGMFIDTSRVSSWVAVLQEYLQTKGVNYETNNRKLLVNEKGDGQEIDFYLPDYGIGIEVNPVGTHSVDTRIGILDEKYHQRKSLLALKAGVPLIHMYDADFADKNTFQKIMDLILVTDKRKIGARQCVVKELSKTIANEFLDKYHLQNGEQRASVRYGLYDGDTLCVVLTFGKSRFTKDSYEIIRYCVRPDYIVIGGFQRLFAQFVSTCHSGDTIVSYMDLNKRFSCENIYEKSGFVEVGLTEPDYVWVSRYGLETLRRYDTMKKKLIDAGYDANKTEVEIMRSRDYYRVYGAGSKRFVFTVV